MPALIRPRVKLTTALSSQVSTNSSHDTPVRAQEMRSVSLSWAFAGVRKVVSRFGSQTTSANLQWSRSEGLNFTVLLKFTAHVS